MTFSEGDGGRFPLAPIQGHWSPENDFLSKGQNGSVRLPGWRAVFGFPGRQPARPAAVTGGSHSTSRSAPSPPCPPQHGRAAANSQPASRGALCSAPHTAWAARMSHHATHTLARSTLCLKYSRVSQAGPC